MSDQNTPQTRRERRWSEAAKGDRERRQVRATNGRQSGTSSKRPIVIQIGGAKPKRRRRPRIRSKKHGVLASLWLITTSVLTLAWLTLGGTLWCVATLCSGLATVATCVLMFDPESVVPDKPRRRPATANPRADGKSKPGGSSSGTRRSPSKPRKRVCSARCQASTKPATTCNCVCRGKTHGSRRSATSIPASTGRSAKGAPRMNVRDTYMSRMSPRAQGLVGLYEALAADVAAPVRLSKIRSYYSSSVEREEIDAALRELADMDGVHVRAVVNQQTLTDKDRAGALRLGGEDRHNLQIEWARIED